MYRLRPADNPQVRLLAASPVLKEAIAAARQSRLLDTAVKPYVTQQLDGSDAPVIAVSDYVKLLAEGIRAYVPAQYVTLGTDGFGRSDTRARLRDFFEVDARWIAFAALDSLHGEGNDPDQMQVYAEKLGLDLMKPLSTTV